MLWKLVLGGLMIITLGGGWYSRVRAQALPVFVVGFVDSLSYATAPLRLHDTTRVYAPVYNGSPEDIFITVGCATNEETLPPMTAPVKRGATVTLWCDVNMRSTTEQVVARITAAAQVTVGKMPTPIEVLFPESAVLTILIPSSANEALALMPTHETSTLIFTTSSVDMLNLFSSRSNIPASNIYETTTDPSRGVGSIVGSVSALSKAFFNVAISSLPTPKSLGEKIWNTTTLYVVASKVSFPTTSVMQLVPTPTSTTGKVVGSVRHSIESIDHIFLPLLKKMQQKLQNSTASDTTSEPASFLVYGAEKFENHQKVIRIPRTKIPSIAEIKLWIVTVGITILATWWLMVPVYLLLLYFVFRLWRWVCRQEKKELDK